MGICKFCKKSFESNAKGKGRPKKYCSIDCGTKAGYEANNRRRRKSEKPQRKIWEGNKKICKTCNIPKELSEYSKRGKDHKGNCRYEAHCKSCINAMPRRISRKCNYKFICKYCGKHSSHYDKRYTTFCSRECSFAHKEATSIKRYCKECNKRLKGEMKSRAYCVECSAIIEQKREEARLLKEKELERERAIRALKRAIKRQAFIKEQAEREKKLNKKCVICKIPFQAKQINHVACSRCYQRMKAFRKMTRDVARGKRAISSLPKDFIEDFGKVECITLDELIKRDKNVCHICKGKCNKKDFKRSENGAFIALDNYPSIDHVLPFSKGGTHTWDNVKLAHFLCNTIKNNETITEEQDQLKFYL